LSQRPANPGGKPAGANPVEHIVIVMKENHTFDNYFGTFPGANGMSMPTSPNPPPTDPNHTHAAWLTRDTTSVREQFVEADIPAYFDYARKFTLCDNYFTDVAGPSTPNHLMVVAADSPVIDNPSNFTAPSFTLPASLPLSLEKAGRTWRSYGGFAMGYMAGINQKWKLQSAQFAADAAAGTLADVSWVWAPAQFDEHPPDRKGGTTGNVTVGMQWTVDQIAAVVKGGLWPTTAIFVTWDDWGGWYDHVIPPDVETWNGNTHQGYSGSQFRYGSRVGCLALGPYAKSGYISNALHSHVSLIRFCEDIFGIKTINARDSATDGMTDCFEFSQSPLPPP
jgi:phospholipase C